MRKALFFFFRDYVVYFIANALPKFNWVAIQTYPDWEDNGIAIYNELLKRNFKGRIVWLTNRNVSIAGATPFEISNRTVFVKRKSLKGFVFYSLCKYIFFTHGTYFNRYPSRQVSINMWHGFGFKAVGLLNNDKGIKTSYILGLSSFANNLIAQEMGMPLSKVLNFGFPRNDIMLKEQINQERRRAQLNIQGEKVVFWMPTYRQSGEGQIRTDGKLFNNPFNLDTFDVSEFNEYCKANNIICFLKLHPMASVGWSDSTNYTNFQLIDNDWFRNNHLTLYQFLGVIDILISDLSSVVTDFLLREKPVIHAFSDLDEYVESRNLLLEPVRDFLVGPLVNNQSDLQRELSDIIKGCESESLLNQRIKIKELFFDSFLGNASEQLLDFIFKQK